MTATHWTCLCLGFVAVLLAVDRINWSALRVVAKLGASTGFVGVAHALGAWDSVYGQIVLLALLLGWLGDALLLASHPAAFLAGLGAFLLSHVAYAVAFGSGEVSWPTVAVAALPAMATAMVVLHWLMPRVPSDMQWPVRVYVVVILAMCMVAAGHAVATGHWAVLAGAVLFAVSDLSVARDRFVAPGYLNRLWGWPVYFIAQLVLAWTVAG